jgi:hypothetical protein
VIGYEYILGKWRAECTVCGTFITCDSLADAYKRGRTHDKVCGR